MSGCDNFDELLTNLNSVAHDQNTPPWAKLLIDCFKGLIGALKINVQQSTTINELKKDVDGLREEVNTLKNVAVMIALCYTEFPKPVLANVRIPNPL